MSGAPSVPLAIAALFVSDSFARIGLGLTAVLCLEWLLGSIWRAERRVVVELRSRLDELLDEYPGSLRLEGINQFVEVFGSQKTRSDEEFGLSLNGATPSDDPFAMDKENCGRWCCPSYRQRQ